ncbi:MAG: LytR C-terminal domain-containing protein [Candidatus Krumholzibacteriota bacterium]|nr:LytR C-terminal domain-containing protein [Candidatus Krumholzibacteriota bacterium]
MNRKRTGSSRVLGGVLLAAFLGLLAFSLLLRYGDALRGLQAPAWLAAGGGGREAPASRAESAAPGDDAPSGDGATAGPVAAEPAKEPEARLRLQILNGTGVAKLAFETGEKLRAWDVDALDRGNAPPWPFPETLLVVRDTRRAAAVQDLARRLGGVPVILQRREDLMVDATLLLGHDWRDYRWPES